MIFPGNSGKIHFKSVAIRFCLWYRRSAVRDGVFVKKQRVLILKRAKMQTVPVEITVSASE
jgi:hypothetical protein